MSTQPEIRPAWADLSTYDPVTGGPTLTAEAAVDWLELFMPDRIMDQLDYDPEDPFEHLLWTGNPTPLGYVRVWNGERLVMMSRWVLENTVGPPPTDKHQAGHVCHDLQMGACPVGLTEFDWHRLCVNPSHLEWMTPQANSMASSRTRAHQIANKLVLPPPAFRPRSDKAWIEVDEATAIYADL